MPPARMSVEDVLEAERKAPNSRDGNKQKEDKKLTWTSEVDGSNETAPTSWGELLFTTPATVERLYKHQSSRDRLAKQTAHVDEFLARIDQGKTAVVKSELKDLRRA